MDSNAKVSDIQKKIVRVLSPREEIISCWLFGSYAKNKQNNLSDIDIAILLDVNAVCVQSDALYKLKILDLLLGALETNNVDLVVINTAPPLLKHRIVTQGVLCFDKQPILQRRFTVKALNEFLDTIPLRKLN